MAIGVGYCGWRWVLGLAMGVAVGDWCCGGGCVGLEVAGGWDGGDKYCHHLHYFKSDYYICVLITSW